MTFSIINILKKYWLAGLMVLATGLSLGNVNSSFGETPMDADIVMTIDTSGSLGDESQMFNNVLNVFTAAFVATGGNLEVVVIDRNAICLSAHTDISGCSDENLSQYRRVMADEKSNNALIIFSAYDQ